MSSSSGPLGQPGPPTRGGPPYAPREIGLGGVPEKIPDIPITAVFLLFYVVFAVIHIKIMRYNISRGHKFIFNGALFGFCKVRIITMCMRIAWACYPRNIRLGIAAQVFVYVGTIILYLCNWFFTQRVVRAQHPRFGWSKPYRIVHRVTIFFVVGSLIIIVVGSIQQFFTLSPRVLKIDKDLQLTGFTYFAAFTVAPLFLLAISFVLPRKGTEKFGAGRLRNAIGVLILGSIILVVGQVFRTAIAWLPPIPVRNAQGRPNAIPWYLSKASFYCFNFLTEFLVVLLYAVMRVDLRFYVPDGANKAGDYRAWRESQFNLTVMGNEKRLKRSSASLRSAMSNETVHEYEGSVFENSRALADSLRFHSSVMEIDDKTGHWKIRRQSASDSTRNSVYPAGKTQSTLWDPTRGTWGAPPVPSHQDWPLREAELHFGGGGGGRDSPAGSSRRLYTHSNTDLDRHLAFSHAISKLEGDTPSTPQSQSQPPVYDSVSPLHQPPQKTYHPYTLDTTQSSRPLRKQHKHTYSITSPTSAVLPRKKDYSTAPTARQTATPTPEIRVSPTTSESTYTSTSAGDLPAKTAYYYHGAAAEVDIRGEAREERGSRSSAGSATSVYTEGEGLGRFSFEEGR